MEREALAIYAQRSTLNTFRFTLSALRSTLTARFLTAGLHTVRRTQLKSFEIHQTFPAGVAFRKFVMMQILASRDENAKNINGHYSLQNPCQFWPVANGVKRLKAVTSHYQEVIGCKLKVTKSNQPR